MDEKHPEIIIIKRHNDHEEEHHGGAWKIAFADFMTAMMAFFLVLWIINATDKNTKTIIARYFNPLKLEDMAKAKKGIRQATGDQAREPPSPDVENAPPTAKTPDVSEKNETPAEEAAEKDKEKDQDKDKDKEPADPAHPTPHFTERALFSDPYASLDQIAGKLPPRQPGKADAAATADAAAGGDSTTKPNAAAGGDAAATADAIDLRAFVDPFKPSAGNAFAAAPPEPPRPPAPAVSEAQKQPPAAPAANAPSPAQPTASSPAAESAPAAARSDAAKLQDELAKELRAETHAQPAPGIEVQETPEGTLISLTDEYNFGMFASGSAEPQPKVVRIMEKIAQILKAHPGAIIVRGHTDNRPYKSGTYDNWRLSSARAQMAYYMLTRAGVPESRFSRVEGYANRALRDPAHPLAAENRRIEILLRAPKP
jgi:chemotaxis protein MotB